MTPRRGWATELCHPLALTAIAVLIANDHLLKGADVLPGAITGKLSDVAGLFFFPLLLIAIGRGVLRWCGRDRLADGRVIIDVAALVTAAVFCAIKLAPELNRAIEPWWGVNLLDPTDVLALPAVAASWLLATSMRRARHGRTGRLSQGLVVSVAALASIATPAPQQPRNYPAWALSSGDTRAMGCARAQAWVSKSGKTGVGLSLQLRRQATPCVVSFSKATLALERGPVVVASRLPNQGDTIIYLPFAFDNNAMWNKKIRRGTFALSLTINGKPHTWSMSAEHRLDGFHQQRRRGYRRAKGLAR